MKYSIALAVLIAYIPASQANTKTLRSIKSWVSKNVAAVVGISACVVGAAIFAARRNNHGYNPIEPNTGFCQQHTNELFELIIWPGEGNPNSGAIKNLLAQGANPNGRFKGNLPTLKKTFGDSSPLRFAVRNGATLEIVQLLVDHEANLNEQKNNLTLIQLAQRHSQHLVGFLSAKINNQEFIQQPLIVLEGSSEEDIAQLVIHTPINRQFHQPPGAPSKVPPLNLPNVNEQPIALTFLVDDLFTVETISSQSREITNLDESLLEFEPLSIQEQDYFQTHKFRRSYSESDLYA